MNEAPHDPSLVAWGSLGTCLGRSAAPGQDSTVRAVVFLNAQRLCSKQHKLHRPRGRDPGTRATTAQGDWGPGEGRLLVPAQDQGGFEAGELAQLWRETDSQPRPALAPPLAPPPDPPP